MPIDAQSMLIDAQSTLINAKLTPGRFHLISVAPEHQFASIKIDLGIINVILSYYTLINPNQLIL